MQLTTIRIDKPDAANFILGQSCGSDALRLMRSSVGCITNTSDPEISV